MGWLSGFKNRKLHTINSASGAGNGYQVLINVRYGTGTDTGNTVFLGGKCKEDFSDIRFTLFDGITQLRYKIIEKTNGDNAKVWVQIIQDLSNYDVNIYLYYNNSNAIDVSDDDTFEIYDDFSDTSISIEKWSYWNMIIDNGVIKSTDDSANLISKENLIKKGHNYLLEAKMQLAGNYDFDLNYYYDWNNRIFLRLSNYPPGTSQILKRINGTQSNLGSVGPTVNLSEWYLCQIARIGTDYTFYVKRLSTSDDGSNTISITDTEVNDKDLKVVLLPFKTGDSCDYIFLRKYTSPEPTHGNWGNEENEPFRYIEIDEGNDKKIGTIVINSDEHIQRITKAKNDIKFQEVLHGSNLNGAESDWIECNGMEEVYVKTYFKNSSDTANIRIGFLDFSDEIVYSPQYTINNLGQADNGDWVGDLKIINVSGYQKIQVKLVSSPSNEIRVEIGGKPNSVDISKGHYFRNTQNVEYTAQTDTCLSKAPNINMQDRPSGANVKGLGYCITGYDSSAGEYTKYCNEYNKNTDSWSSKTQCPSPSRNDAYASNIYSKIYIVGGRNSAGSGISDNDEYIPITDGWSSKTNYPHAFAGPRSGVLYNKSYVAGESYCDMYVLDSWTTKTNRPVNEVMCGCFVLTHSKLYLAGGYHYTSRHDEYTPDTWVNKTDLPTPARGIMDGTTIQNKGYVLGGYTGSTEAHDVDEYDSVTNSWVSKNDCASFGASNTVITL